MFTIYEYIERAIKVEREFFRDRQYVVRDGEVVIVDEFTGRVAEGRKWRDGLHQAVEAQEERRSYGRNRPGRPHHRPGLFPCSIRPSGGHDRHGDQLGRELRKIYKLRVMPIPTNRPAIRERLPDRVFGTADDKWHAIVEEIGRSPRHGPARADRHALDRQVGAPVRAAQARAASSTTCSTPITSRQKPRSSPRQDSRGRVTVSTNMAGRGTDIKLGEGVDRTRRPARDLHRNARRGPHRPPACSAAAVARAIPARTARTWRWTTICCWPAWARRSDGSTSCGRTVGGTAWRSAGLSPRPSARSSAATSATGAAADVLREGTQEVQRQMGQDPYLDTPGS